MPAIKIKSAGEIEKIRKACKIAAEVREKIGKAIKPGVTTEDLDRLGEELIRKKGALPIFKGYRGYKHATCISVNEQIVHGIPGKRKLRSGDIVSVDVGTQIEGYCGDTAATFAVGKISSQAEHLIRICEKALYAAIEKARAVNRLGDICFAVEETAKKYGYSVVRELYGHGIGSELHEDPLIPNYGEPGEGPELRAGMVFAIEPMLNIGTWKIKTLDDGWTVVTEDGKLSSHFEHTVVITEKDPIILTI